MKQLYLFLALVTACFTFSSCYTLLFKSYGILDKSASPKKISSSNKEVIYIPMHHVGKKEFYADVKMRLDSLQKEGYAIYYEGTKYTRENDSLKNDTIAMKLRKVLGIDLNAMKSQGGYLDTLNGTLVGKKIKAVSKHHLVNQPKNYLMLDTITAKRADIYLSDALLAFEEKYGTVVLTDCDYRMKTGEKYTCDTYKQKEARQFILIDYRNQHLSGEILNDPHSKIAIIYGAKHFKGVLENLQQKDSTWKSIY